MLAGLASANGRVQGWAEMRWQDLVLAGGSLLLAAALVPTLRSSHKPALWTCLITAACLSMFTVVYGSLSLWYSTGTTALTSLCWWILAYQRRRMSRQPVPAEG
jgi:hypothetical protein